MNVRVLFDRSSEKRIDTGVFVGKPVKSRHDDEHSRQEDQRFYKSVQFANVVFKADFRYFQHVDDEQKGHEDSEDGSHYEDEVIVGRIRYGAAHLSEW